MKSITVHVHDQLNLESLQKVLASIMTKAGHPGCLSGYNLNFMNAVDPAERVFIVERGGQQIIGG